MKCKGCGKEIENPKSWQKFCSDKCRIQSWHFKNCGSLVISEMRKEIEAIKTRMAAFDEFVKNTVKP